MTTQRDIATQIGALSVGATAFLIGDPGGGTLLATPLTALAAIGITLKSGCAERAAGKAEAAVLKALGAAAEFDADTLEAARTLLADLPHAGQIDPKALVRAVHGEDFETAATREILRALGLRETDGPLHGLMTRVTAAGLAATKQDPEFRAALTLELLIETARKQGHEIALAEDTNARVRDIASEQADTNAMLRELLERTGGFDGAMRNPESLSLEELRALAARFGETDGHDRAGLTQFLALKAEEYRALRAEVEGIDDGLKRLANLKAAARDAIARVDLDEVEALLSRVQEVELEEAAKTAELRAENALLRGRVDQAYSLLSAAADSFAAIDPLEPARRRILRYFGPLREHGLRYGGPGLALSQAMIEAAIRACPRETDPQLWARAQNALGIALQEQGIRTAGAGGAGLLALAVAAYGAALEVNTPQDHPLHWAATQNNLAAALQEQGIRTAGAEGAGLLARAVAAYGAALEVTTRQDHPLDWAMTQNNLAIALQAQGSRTAGAGGAGLLARAVTAYGAALEVRTRQDHPLDWAMTQNNLAIALSEQGSRTAGAGGAGLLARAVTACGAALEVTTRQDHPLHWAMTKENLALAELARAEHDGTVDAAPHLQAALGHVTAALEVYDPDHTPYDHETATRLRADIEAALAARPA